MPGRSDAGSRVPEPVAGHHHAAMTEPNAEHTAVAIEFHPRGCAYALIGGINSTTRPASARRNRARQNTKTVHQRRRAEDRQHIPTLCSTADERCRMRSAVR